MKKLDVNFINPFIEATVRTLKIQCDTEVLTLPPMIKGKSQVLDTDIAGVIGITSKEFTGSIAICFPRSTFNGIMRKMCGGALSEDAREAEDGAGELLNIIFGQARTALNERGHSIKSAIPTIIHGKSIHVRHLAPGLSVVIPFESAYGQFRLEIGLDTE